MFESYKTRQMRREMASTSSVGDVQPDADESGEEALSAVERHRRARLLRESRKPNPVLEQLAAGDAGNGAASEKGVDSAEDDDQAVVDALGRDIADFLAAQRPSFDDEKPRDPVEPVFAGFGSGGESPYSETTKTRETGRRSAAQQDRPRQRAETSGLLASIWSWRLPIAALTGIGLGVGVLVALSSPHRYTAHAQILVDPREFRLVGTDIAPGRLDGEATLAIIDSQLQFVGSTGVLEKVVERARLSQDPEFNGTGDALGGLFGSVRAFMSIFFDGADTDERDRTAIRALRERLSAERARNTYVIDVGVTTFDPEKSALIANEVTTAFVEEQESLRAETARLAATALGGRLEVLRVDVEEAERALEHYKASNGLIGPSGRLVTDSELAAVAAQLAEAKAATIGARVRADAAKSVDLRAIVSGGLPQDLTTPALNSLRTQHAAERRAIAALEKALGPRHPKLVEAQAAQQSLESDIGAELRRIVAGSQADLRRAVQAEQALSASLAGLKAASVNNDEARVGLRELERKATAARTVYEASLLRAREAGEIEALGTSNVRIVSPAEAPQQPASLSHNLVIAGFGAGGFALGLLLAAFAGLRRGVAARSGDRMESEHVSPQEFAEEPAMSGSGSYESAVAAAVRMTNEFDAAAESSGNTDCQTDEISADQSGETESESAMYPYPPQYPAHPQQAQPTQHGPHAAPQPTPWPAPAIQPLAVWPAQPVVGWPMPPQAHGAPYAPYPAAAAPYAPYVWPAQQPMPQPMAPAAAWPSFEPAQPQQVRSPEPAPLARDEEELEDLRESVRALRKTVEALMDRRSDRDRRVA